MARCDLCGEDAEKTVKVKFADGSTGKVCEECAESCCEDCEVL